MSIIFKGRDGSVAIMTVTPGAGQEEAARKFKDAHPDFYTDYFELPEGSKLPSSREFRDAWTCKGEKIVVDASKAKDIHLGRIRHVRNIELDKLDKEQLRHLAEPDKLKELDEKKQVLRDLPEHIKGLEWPDVLPK